MSFRKFEKEMEKKREIRKTLGGLKSAVDRFSKRQQEYIEKARAAHKSGNSALYSLARSGVKTSMLYQAKAEEMYMNFQLAADIKDMGAISDGFLKGMSRVSKDILLISRSMNFSKTYKDFHKSMFFSQNAEEKLRGILEENGIVYQERIDALSEMTDGDLDRIIGVQTIRDEENIDEQLDALERENARAREAKIAKDAVSFPDNTEGRYVPQRPAGPPMPVDLPKPAEQRKPAERAERQTDGGADVPPFEVPAAPPAVRKIDALFDFRHVDYRFPPLELLGDYAPDELLRINNETGIERTIEALESKLSELGIDARHAGYSVGPTFTRLEMRMPRGVQVGKVAHFENDIVMAVNKSVRLELPIVGKDAFGVEIPNVSRETVGLKQIVSGEEFAFSAGSVNYAMGVDIERKPFVGDLSDAPHLLVAGATGSGKSCFLHSLICSLFYRHTPDEVRLLLVDFKRVELNRYNGLPFLIGGKAVDDDGEAARVFDKLIGEMDRRYVEMEKLGVRNLKEYNERVPKKLPFIVTVIDEYADIITSPYCKKFETQMRQLMQKARASGIHVIVSTQRPTVDVINGTVRANIPARAAFYLPGKTDSRTILNAPGAESLAGKGHFLFLKPGSNNHIRLQAPYISNGEIDRIIGFIKNPYGYVPAKKDRAAAPWENIPGEEYADDSETAAGYDAAEEGFYEADEAENGRHRPVLQERRDGDGTLDIRCGGDAAPGLQSDGDRILDLLTGKYSRQTVSKETVAAELGFGEARTVAAFKALRDVRLINLKIEGVIATVQAYEKLGKEFKPF